MSGRERHLVQVRVAQRFNRTRLLRRFGMDPWTQLLRAARDEFH